MALFSKIFAKLKGTDLSAADWDELRKSLIEADLGAALSDELIEVAKRTKLDDLTTAVGNALSATLATTPRDIASHAERLTTIMVVGVNGTGKTTSVAKLTSLLKDEGKSITLCAADTFRAAAIEQLQTWGARLGVNVIAGKFQGDPASVAFDAAAQAKENRSDYLIIDTAGRLHTANNLMDELGKIRRVVEKSTPIDEVLLVIDATTGQNGIAQAKSFISSVSATGLILTKLDGSAKGGIALAIEKETGVPIKFVGTGESASDFGRFDPESYISGLLA
jgi:fused signal recognition particle receptor